MKPFLILQLRPEDEASDNEYEAFLHAGGLSAGDTHRIRMERDGVPDVDLDRYSGIIVGGGPYCVSDAVKPPEQTRFESQLDALLSEVVKRDMPYLGACYGLGILSRHLGGIVSKEKFSEQVGPVTIQSTEQGRNDPLLSSVSGEFQAFGGHKEACQDTPPGAVLLASSDSCPIQMIRVGDNIYATQFHAELDGEGLAVRIRIYRHAGYFPPQEAEQLIAMARGSNVTEPEKILKAFIDTYTAPK